ncbi:hypothetical protein [Lentzea sp. CA-135723]|uniref:hypothetical protein n=1 Tax=Lentzea sp. CA-135723 TaxID=3239950 RepID=UPI003D90047C
MAFDLPPRRDLPEDVKERMRPDFTETVAPRRRSRAPLAVAAGVILLVAGGVVVTQTASHQVSPGHVRVVTPSDRDLARCRTALGDQNWQSTEMVVFHLRKVLYGKDGRFCELTRSKASVASPGFKPVAMTEGSVAYRSEKIIAGVPPAGATTVKRMPNSYTHIDRNAFTDKVVTERFFVAEIWGWGTLKKELFFDDRPVETPPIDPKSSATTTVSFESGEPDPRSPSNILAQCADQRWEAEGVNGDQLEGWEPLAVLGTEEPRGVLVARRGETEYATCYTYPRELRRLEILSDVQEEPDRPYLISGEHIGESYEEDLGFTASDYSVMGRVGPHARTVEVSDRDGSAITAEVSDGFFLATVPLRDGREEIEVGAPLEPGRLHVVVRDDHDEVVYEGELLK